MISTGELIYISQHGATREERRNAQKAAFQRKRSAKFTRPHKIASEAKTHAVAAYEQIGMLNFAEIVRQEA